MAVSVVSPRITAAAIALLLVLAAVPAAVAETYKVGDASGWDSGVDYTDWVKGKTFKVGDTLEFKYGSTHSVDEVDKAGYDNCDPSKAIQKLVGGDNKVDLKTAGPMYFICPTPGHCTGGMKLAITVQAGGGGSTPATPVSPGASPAPAGTPSDSTPAGGSPGTPSTPPPPSSASRGLVSYGMIGISVVLGYMVGFMG